MPAPSLIVTNARIYTSDSSAPWAEGLAVASDGTIAAVGSTAEIEKLEGSETQRLDAAGGFVMPGEFSCE
jgi:predicted amidohydrolase YtcJ